MSGLIDHGQRTNVFGGRRYVEGRAPGGNDRCVTRILAQGANQPSGVFEEVGAFIDQSHADLYLFSSDYPHTEGGRNPISRFETTLGDRSETIRDKFYSQNFLRIFPEARV